MGMNYFKAFCYIEVVCILILSLGVYHKCFNRDRRFPLDDLGFIWVVLVNIYTLLPFLAWLAVGCEYSPVHGRLYQIQPNWDEVTYLISVGLSYIVGFASIYLFMIDKAGTVKSSPISRIDSHHIVSAATIVLGSLVVQLAVHSMGILERPSSYIEQYKVVQQLPLGIRQIIKISTGWANVALMILIVAFLQRWPKQQWMLFLYIFYLLAAFDPTSSRAGLFLGLFALLTGWHVLKKPFSAKSILIAGGIGLAAFTIIGWYRNYLSLVDILSLSGHELSVGEFESIWANSIELLQSRSSVQASIPWYVRYEEFFGFIPSQLLWFPKDSLSNWFLDNFHPFYKDQGGGLAFGILAQAIVGSGILEGFIRGIILGYILGKAMVFMRLKNNQWWVFPLQLYLLTWMFQNVRTTSFALLGMVVQLVLPAIVITHCLGLILRRSVKYEAT